MSLPKTMKALVASSATDYRLIQDYPVPTCGDDDIILQVEGCGICAGDLKCQHGAPMFWGDKVQPGYVEPPFIPGHEFVGHAVAVGKNVTHVQIGMRLVADQIVPCWECRFCNDGHYWMCQQHKIFGFFDSLGGGMAEYMRLPKGSIVHEIPESMPLTSALLIEPYACSKHCVDRAQIGAEDIVVLSGAGTLGLGMATYARQRGPKSLIVLDMMDERLDKALRFGADMAWNPSKVDVVEKIMAMTDGYGCDIYIEATGNPSSVVQGMQMIRKLGRFVEFSVFAEPTSLDWSIIGDRKELDVLGSHLSPYCFPYVIEKIGDGTLKTDGVVSATFPIEAWEQAFDHASGKYGDFKVAITF